jgi:hypothetical protein
VSRHHEEAAAPRLPPLLPEKCGGFASAQTSAGTDGGPVSMLLSMNPWFSFGSGLVILGGIPT